MKTYFYYFLFLLIFIYTQNIFAAFYPKSRAEQKAEKLGSIFEDGGLSFQPLKVKNNSTQNSVGKVNTYLWQASIETLNVYPIASVNIKTGIIVTDWFSKAGNPNSKIQIEIHINDDVISPSAIEVIVSEQNLKNSKTAVLEPTTNLASEIEQAILTKARKLFINDPEKRQ